MTTTEKRKFIRKLTKEIAKYAIEKAPKMPRSWDGHELREYLADKFVASRSNLMTATRSRRRYDYTHDLYNLGIW
jgi:hypothetical protein